jgi:hypothetical protein
MSGSRYTMGLDWDFALPPKSVRSTFHCRDEACAAFYRQEVDRYHSIGAACIITAWKDSYHNEVAGFITYAPNGLRGQKYNKALKSELGPNYLLEGKSLPCWLIGQLARSNDTNLKGLGKRLVWLAIIDIVQRARHGAGSCIMIEAEHRPLVNYYMKEFDFMPLHPCLQNWKEVGTTGGGKMLLVLPMQKAENMLRQAGVVIDN